jgi:hypothetical protein
MGFGTVWKMGKPEEARLLWENHFPEGRPEIYLKFVTQIELEELRGLLHDPETEAGPSLPVYEGGYPTPDDPEWERWYANQAEEFSRYIYRVNPQFLEELASVSPEKFEALDCAWGFPRQFLVELIEFARIAIRRKMIGFARGVF